MNNRYLVPMLLRGNETEIRIHQKEVDFDRKSVYLWKNTGEKSLYEKSLSTSYLRGKDENLCL